MVKEYQFTELEKQTKAYSKVELARFKKQFEAESLMNQVRNMVTKIMIEKADLHSTQAVTPAMVKPQVDYVMAKSVDQILNFLAQNGVKLPPPPPPRAAPVTSPTNGQGKLRQMVQQKLLKETDLSGAALANKVDLIMSLPRPKILSILQREIPPPPPRAAATTSPRSAAPSKPYNWIKESNDYWDYLPPPVQEALKVLGYNESLWNNNEQPALSDKAYPELTPQQQKAVRILGCSPQEWDETDATASTAAKTTPPPPPPPPTEDDKTNNSTTTTPEKKKVTPEERAMMLKIKEMVTFKLRTELNITSQDPSETILLNKAVMEILNLPREGVQEYLKRPLLPPRIQAQFQPPPPEQRNWVWDSKAYWYALPPHIQEAAKVLGYDEVAWNNTEQPEESDMPWRHLSIRQQEAAITLGYTKDSWDEGDGDQHTGYSDSEDEGDDDDTPSDAVGELDSDDESEDFSESEEEEEVANDFDESVDDEDQFISNFIIGGDEDEDAEDLIANFISDDPNVVRELSKKDSDDEVLDDDSDDGADIPFISNSILRKESSDDEDDDDDFYTNFRNEGKQQSGDVLTEDETESTEEKEKAPEEQKFSSQLETFMSLWSFKI